MKNNNAVKRLLALAGGIILFAGGAVATALSVLPTAKAAAAADAYANAAYNRSEKGYDAQFSGYPVIVAGKPVFEKDSAEDAILGVKADALALYRISEMYQWVPDGDGYKLEWREELVDTGDDEHKNPTAYPTSLGSAVFAAQSVRLSGYRLTDEQVASIKTREAVKTLPKGEIRGFHADGEYLTNADDMDSPKAGDIRIRFECAASEKLTLAGLQRSEQVNTGWKAPNGLSVYGFYEGSLTAQEAADAWAKEAGGVDFLLLPLRILATVVGGGVLVCALMSCLGCNLTIKLPRGKKRGGGKTELSGARAALVYGTALGVLAFLTAIAAAWAPTAPLPLFLLLLAALAYFYFLIPSVVKNTPRRPKKEDPYEPILRRRDEFGKK